MDLCKKVPPAIFFDAQSRGSSPRLARKIFISLLVLTAVVAGGCVLPAQEKAKLPGDDWVSLFNGSNLDGWVKIGNESWTVEDGLLHGRGLTPNYGYLETEKDYNDFHLSLD